MGQFIDLVGASGATYRFRAWPDAGQAPIAGNFAVASRTGPELKVQLLGVTTDLSRALAQVAVAGLSGKPVFVRLNVARAARHAVHDDLIAAYASAQVVDAEPAS